MAFVGILRIFISKYTSNISNYKQRRNKHMKLDYLTQHQSNVSAPTRSFIIFLNQFLVSVLIRERDHPKDI